MRTLCPYSHDTTYLLFIENLRDVTLNTMILLSTYIASFLLIGLSIFQLTLALGAPIGRFAWGGQHIVLPTKLRISSLLSIVLYFIFLVFLWSATNLIAPISNAAFVTMGVWIIAMYMLLGIAMNAISRSKSERFLMTPVASILALCFLVVALAR